MSKFTNYLFLILTVINFVSILGIYYLYQTKIAHPNESHKLQKITSSRSNLVIVDTHYGQVGGLKQSFQSKDVVAYLGIPFAQPPIGKLRFHPPKETVSWNGTVFEATNWPNPCVQPDNKLRLNNYEFSEDCLYLNVWTPMQKKNPAKKPVIVVIHTGAFIFGSASEATYNGLALASMGDLVVVTFNYRLNFFGFVFAGNDSERVTPNAGMLDQVAALQWVKANIGSFNGDPERITLAGQSSGGLSVGMHITSPLSRGTFSQAIIMSGSPLQTPVLNRPEHVSQFWANYARHINCANSAAFSMTAEVMTCIEAAVARNRNLMPTMPLVKKLSTDSMFVNLPIVIDDRFQPRSQVELLLDTKAEMFKNFSLLFGYTNDEGSWIAAMEDEVKFGAKATPSINRQEATELVEIFLGKMKTTKEDVNVTSMVNYYLRHMYDIQNHDAKHEALVLSRLVSSLLGDHYISCPANLFANLLLGHSSVDIYQYYWTYKGNPRSSAFWSTFANVWCGKWMASCHSFEMFALFGIPFLEPTTFDSDDRVVSMKTIQMVSYFAYNGKLFWPKFTAVDSATKTEAAKVYYIMDNLLEQVKFGTDLKMDVCDNIWQEYLL